MDPIQREDFNIRRGRVANPERMEKIKDLAMRTRVYNKMLETQIREAIKTGHSYRQVASAANVSVSVIQRMVHEEENND